ncbi:vegetative cell wall protein gp1-like [Solanum dulcamara]|uniref:vegetative cell wall protein gp1-like n=1 Tax=Solanum dulcamara TaxID=45834 RepID=UPI0024869177|nr:vegetative cell wall protein gp1-like [Solanum dulcamara]
MAMSPATLRVLCFTFFYAILSIQQCICADSPENSPSPAPESGGDLGSLPLIAKSPGTPSPSPSVSSPPLPSQTDRSPNSAPAPSPVSGGSATPFPAPSPVTDPPSPAPSPSDVVASDISQESTTVEVNESSSSDGGMNGGKKAGVAFGVMAAACVVGLGALVYKKRRQNIRRAQFGYAGRRDFL